MNGMIHGIQFSDPTRVVQSLSVERSYDTKEFWFGKQLIRLFSDSTVTLSLEMENSQSSGIKTPNLGGSNVLDQVQAVYSERTNTIPKIPRNPGEEVVDDERMMKAYADGVRWLGVDTTITVSGKGEQVWDETKQGTLVTGTIESADGPFYLTFPDTMKVEKIGKGSTNDGEFDTWTGEGTVFTENPGATSQNVLSVPTELLSLVPSPSVVVLQDTYVMSGDYPTNAKQSTQITAHLSS